MDWPKAKGGTRVFLFVIVGVLLVPALAVAARLTIAWQSGSVVVRKAGPLPKISAVITESDWWTDESGYGRYVHEEPLPVPPLNLNGAVETQFVITGETVVPEDLAQAAADVYSDNPGLQELLCFLNVVIPVNLEVGGARLLWLYSDTASEALDWAGARPFRLTVPIYPPAAAALPDTPVIFSLECYGNDGENSGFGIPLELPPSPVEVTISSIRVLAV